MQRTIAEGLSSGDAYLTSTAVGGSVDIVAANSEQTVRSALQTLESDGHGVNGCLDAVASSSNHLIEDLVRLDLLRALVGTLTASSRSISGNILSNASSTAQGISSAVKRLDTEQARVSGTLGVVESVSELRACILGLTGSMGAPQDWETAAGYLNRASKISPTIVDGAFAEKVVPTAEVPDTPKMTLDSAAESLQGLFLREFEKAATEGNGTKVTRFFKLFPLIGKSEIGLEVYGRYVCSGVASRARTNLSHSSNNLQHQDRFVFAQSLTRLFEHIAQIIDNHGGLVERHYGSGSMIKVIERLQLEADVQGGIILDAWTDERNVDRKLTEIKSYAFTFLVQSFLPSAPRNTSARADSPAKKNCSSNGHQVEEEAIDLKEIDNLMAEVTLMLGRWALYTKFITVKCKTSTDQKAYLSIPDIVANSSLRRKVAARLITPFEIMTAFYLRRSVEKAFQLDEQPVNLSLDIKQHFDSNPPYISSAVDDVMYIVSQILDKVMHTSQRAVVATIIPTISRVLSSDFIGMVQRKMRDEFYPKAAVQGGMPPENVTIAFLVLLNNLDTAVIYAKRITATWIGSTKGNPGDLVHADMSLATLFPLENDASYAREALRGLEKTFNAKASELAADGLFVAFKNIVKPRLRPMLADAFRDVEYHVDQDVSTRRNILDEAEAVIDGSVQSHFLKGWEQTTKPIFRLLTEQNIDKLLSLIATYLAEVLEKRIWSYYGRLDRFGGVNLERDVASVVNIVVRGGGYRLRETFARCTQICMMMNMEDDEWEGFDPDTATDSSQIEWQLNADERARARMIIRTKN